MDDDQQVSGGYLSSCNPIEEVQKVEGKMDNLLEECWFFDNLLLRKTRYSSRSNTDPSHHASSSSSSKQQEYVPSVSEVYAEIIKQESLTAQETSDEGVITDKKISKHKNRSALMRANHGHNRTPSLPVNMGIELKESCQECVPPKVSRLSKQTSLTPNLQSPGKGHAEGRISRTDSLNLDAINEMRNGYMKYQKNTRKTASALEHEEVQGFKDLGFNFDTSNLSPIVESILPGLQDKKKAMSNIDEVKSKDTEENVNVIRRNPYLSEAWQLQRSSSSISNWVVRKSSEDMKAQLKSWARTVASNVR